MHSFRAKTKRSYLFLQGPPSKFWLRLGDALTADGNSVIKVNFSFADHCYWGLRPAVTFRRRFADWSATLERLIKQKKITDIVYYNDGFPYHDAAMNLAHSHGIRAWCVEFGYLRPDWITLEPCGMNDRSQFPELPDAIERLANFGTAPNFNLQYPHTFAMEAVSEVTFNLLQAIGRPYNMWFRSDKKVPPLFEYLGWLQSFFRLPQDRRKANALMHRLKQRERDFFLATMQMEGDYQVRRSRLGNMDNFLEEVLQSFAWTALDHSHLIIKAHPLEGGWRNWEKKVNRLARKFNIAERVHFLRGGDLETVLRHVRGLVVINSTTGMQALKCGTPVIALGNPIYNRNGLTHGSDLSSFWHNPKPVDQVNFNQFLKALSVIQVKGSFYNKAGQQHAIREIVARLTDEGSTSVHSLLSSTLTDNQEE